MSDPDVHEVVGFVGGTGPQGRGLAARLATAGHVVHLGSRSRERAAGAVRDIAERVGTGADVRAATNDEAASAGDIVVVAVPYDAQASTLPPLRESVAGKVVLNMVNPMAFDDLGPKAVPVAAGSSAEECQGLWPEARVVSAFHDVSSRRLLRVHEPIRTHVLICGDDREAVRRVAALAARIEGMRGVYCGPLRNSRYIEDITAVILSINAHYEIHAGLLIDGVEREP